MFYQSLKTYSNLMMLFMDTIMLVKFYGQILVNLFQSKLIYLYLL